MNQFESRWERLVAAARQAPPAEPVSAPYGFATRVAARAFESERPALLGLFGRLGVRALWIACVLTMASVAANYLAFPSSDEDEQALLDPVSEVLGTS
jgi:hypothetical protein